MTGNLQLDLLSEQVFSCLLQNLVPAKVMLEVVTKENNNYWTGDQGNPQGTGPHPSSVRFSP